MNRIKTDKNKPEALVLVGLPGSGKSTWAKNHSRGFEVASTDQFIESYVKAKKLQYHKVMHDYLPTARLLFKEQIQKMIKLKKPFIWDQTNLTREKRQKVYDILSNTHRIVFVVFLVPISICITRNNSRKKTGKYIKEDVVQKLIKEGSYPEEDENCDSIFHIIHPKWKNRPKSGLISEIEP